jgi:heterodisulfide reductase subunit C
MSELIDQKEDLFNVDFAFWRDESQENADYWAIFCQQCGACITSCPAQKHGSNFNPREIMLKARYGLAGTLLVKDSILWQCFNCGTCRDRCPQEQSPADVISQLRKLLVEVLFPESPSDS